MGLHTPRSQQLITIFQSHWQLCVGDNSVHLSSLFQNPIWTSGPYLAHAILLRQKREREMAKPCSVSKSCHLDVTLSLLLTYCKASHLATPKLRAAAILPCREGLPVSGQLVSHSCRWGWWVIRNKPVNIIHQCPEICSFHSIALRRFQRSKSCVGFSRMILGRVK